MGSERPGDHVVNSCMWWTVHCGSITDRLLPIPHCTPHTAHRTPPLSTPLPHSHRRHEEEFEGAINVVIV